MRKVFCMVMALLLCMSLVVPAYAAENGFVPSVTYKPDPEIVLVEGDDGEEHVGIIRDENGDVQAYASHGCVMTTPVAHVWDEEIDVPAEIETLLITVYEALDDGSMKLPYEKLGEDVDADNMVIRDLFDTRLICEDHREMLEAEGTTFEITFNLGIVADAQIYAMVYDEATQEWNPVVKIVNNGDGTVTCTFDRLGVVAFSMPGAADSVPSDDVQSPNVLPWIIVLILAVVGVVIVVAKKKKASV